MPSLVFVGGVSLARYSKNAAYCAAPTPTPPCIPSCRCTFCPFDWNRFFFHSPSPDTINHGNYGAGRDVNPSRCDHRFQTEQESIRQLASETKKVAHSVVMICHGGGGQGVAGERTAPSHKSCRGRRPVSGSHCDASSWTRGGGPMHKQDEHAVLQGMSHLAGKHFAVQNPPTIVSHRPSGVN